MDTLYKIRISYSACNIMCKMIILHTIELLPYRLSPRTKFEQVHNTYAITIAYERMAALIWNDSESAEIGNLTYSNTPMRAEEHQTIQLRRFNTHLCSLYQGIDNHLYTSVGSGTFSRQAGGLHEQFSRQSGWLDEILNHVMYKTYFPAINLK